MKMSVRVPLRGVVCGALAVTALLSVPSSQRYARASEAKGDLNLELRLVETVPARAVARTVPTGIAKIEVLVDSFREVHGLQISVERADGSPWLFKGRPSRPQPTRWSKPGGEPWEPGAEGITVPSRGAIRTVIEVPLDGAADHEIVVRAIGHDSHGVVTTEAVVHAPLGVKRNIPVDDGTSANFSLQQGVK